MSSRQPYCPDRGDLIWLLLDPRQGREQKGRRPALVLSPLRYNRLSRLCILCPITNQSKGYPFEVPLPAAARTTGVVVADQVRSLAWPEREAEFIEPCPELAAPVLGRIKALLGL